MSGGLQIAMQPVPATSGALTSPQILSGIKVTADPQKKCSQSVYQRADTWYKGEELSILRRASSDFFFKKGPYTDPFADRADRYVYAINCGGAPYLSPGKRIYFSVDQGYWHETIPDGAGGRKLGW